VALRSLPNAAGHHPARSWDPFTASSQAVNFFNVPAAVCGRQGWSLMTDFAANEWSNIPNSKTLICWFRRALETARMIAIDQP
jgi:hypothetical protein